MKKPKTRFKFKQMGIKRKVLLGCIILAAILFFSSLISIFEFTSAQYEFSVSPAERITERSGWSA